MDPITIALLGGTALSGLIGRSDSRRAERTAQQNAAFQRAMTDYMKKNIPVQERGLEYAMDAADEQREGLDEARDIGNEGLALALSGRTDAQGNKIEFVPGQGWVTTLGSQGREEQFRTGERSRYADTRYRESQGLADEQRAQAIAHMRYGGGPSEEALTAEITNLIMDTLGSGDRALKELVGRQDLRQQGNLPVIVRGGGGEGGATEGSRRLAEAKLAARKQALEEIALRTQNNQQKYLPLLGSLDSNAATAYGQAGAASKAVGEDPITNRLAGESGQMQQLALQMAQNKGNLVNAGYGRVAQGAGEVGNAYGRISQAYGLLNPASANVNNAVTNQTRATMGTAEQMNNMARNMIAAGRPTTTGRAGAAAQPAAPSTTQWLAPDPFPAQQPNYENWYNW